MNDGSVKIMSFNLRKDSFFAKKFTWADRCNLVIEIIRCSNADIIGVQEMTPMMKRDLEQLLPDYSIFGTGRNRKLLGEYSAIFVRRSTVDVLSNHTFWLSSKPNKQGSRAMLTPFPRICTTIEAYIKESKQRIRVFNTHFDHLSWFARRMGAQTILDYIQQYNDKDQLPVLLTGDFNAKPSSNAIKTLMTSNQQVKLNNIFSYFKIDDQFLNTYHGFKQKLGKYPIDYIFFSNEFKAVDFAILKERQAGAYASDHYPIVAVLKIQ